MQARVKYGLIAGAAGLVVNVCVAFVAGICGPLTALAAGGVAGVLTARGEPAATKEAGARSGAVAGAIAGALVLAGQLAGGLAALALLHAGRTPLLVGRVPPPGAGAAEIALYYASGLLTALCFGAIGVAVAAGAGAAAGYLAAPAAATPAPGELR